MHKAILKNRKAFDYLVDCVHKLMELEDWDNAKTLNHFRLNVLISPVKEIEIYYEAVVFMKTLACLKQESVELYNLIVSNNRELTDGTESTENYM